MAPPIHVTKVTGTPFHRDERGMVAIFFALTMAVLMGFSAVSLDAGNLYVTRQRLMDVADAAALAGVQFLPEDPWQARNTAEQYAVQNGLPSDQVLAEVAPGGTSLKVTVGRTVSFHFAPVLGQKYTEVQAVATASVGQLTSLNGVVPLGVERGSFTFGETYSLKLGPGSSSPDPHHGNFHALALGGKGASVYRENLSHGFSQVLRVGDTVETEPGNMAGPTQEGISARLRDDGEETWESYGRQSRRRVYVPIVDSFDVNGRKEVKIVGFAAFFLEEEEDEDDGPDHDHHSVVIKGRFVREYREGEMGDFSCDDDFGLRALRLIH
ncbi:MAG: pilus assembly protein TadG-related protein [Firmicutes bacterium]|nr:pilus assembly protein TadG-related protein [Bacillota bacterium]